MTRSAKFRLPGILAAVLALAIAVPAQSTHNPPATDSAAQASPIRPAPKAPATDSAAQASPIPSTNSRIASIAPHTAIPVKLARAIDSGHLRNGETVQATLSSTVPLAPKGTLQAGTPVELTVVETLPAGRLYAAGEFSLQIVRVGSVAVSSDTLTYRGQPGHKDLPDSAPAVGTNAGLAAGAELTFHVLPPPTAVSGPPRPGNISPGAVSGTATGSAPPASSTMPAQPR